MIKLRDTSPFRKDIDRLKKQGKNIDKLASVLSVLREENPLPTHLRDHKLWGEWEGCRSLHVAPDWILLYRVDKVITLLRTGSHSEILKR